jgi:hypothetical protein
MSAPSSPSATPAGASPRRAGAPLLFAALAGLGILAGLVVILFSVLGVGVDVMVPGVNTSPAPAGSAAALTRDRVALALQDASFQVQDPTTDFRTGETATLLGTPRRLLQAVIPSDPQHGYIVIYEFDGAGAADAAGQEFWQYLHSGTGAIGYPQDEQFVLRRMGSTLIFFPWSPSVSPDPAVAHLASVLGGLGNPVSGQS